jgi:hypothetical protein
VLLMPFVSIFGVTQITFFFMLCLIAGLAVVDILIIYVAVKKFRREAML